MRRSIVCLCAVSLLSLAAGGFASGAVTDGPVYAQAWATWNNTNDRNWSDGTGYLEGTGSVSTGVRTFEQQDAYVSLTGSAMAEATTGVLKAAASVDYIFDFGSETEMAYLGAAAGGEYRQLIQVDNANMFGQPIQIGLDFGVTGTAAVSGAVTVRIVYGCDIVSGGNFGTTEGVEGGGGGEVITYQSIFYIDWMNSQDNPAQNVPYDETVTLDVKDAVVGTPLDLSVSMSVDVASPSWYGYSWNDMDTAGQGSMDFSHTGELQYVSILDPGTGGTLAVFDATDGSLVSGSPDFTVTLIPEPATLALLGLGGIGLLRRRRA